MYLKKHYEEKQGLTPVIEKNGSSLKMLELDMLVLKAGKKTTVSEKAKDFALVVLSGTCSVSGAGFSYTNVGARKSVFDGPAATVFIPMDTAFTVTAETDVKIAVCKSPAQKKFKPALVSSGEVVIKHLGKNGWKREAHFNLDDRVDANLLYIGEAFAEGGMWASYPPHKHDEDNMPAEGILEEYYYYEFDKPAGFGIQKVYTKDGAIDETYTVTTGDVVEIPKGYHPYACAPGYRGYYLWVMAGKNRGFFMTTDEKHKWLC